MPLICSAQSYCLDISSPLLLAPHISMSGIVCISSILPTVSAFFANSSALSFPAMPRIALIYRTWVLNISDSCLKNWHISVCNLVGFCMLSNAISSKQLSLLLVHSSNAWLLPIMDKISSSASQFKTFALNLLLLVENHIGGSGSFIVCSSTVHVYLDRFSCPFRFLIDDIKAKTLCFFFYLASP